MPRFDAVIVGGGPAGSVAALCLACAGARVALVERRAFPRDKACGDLVGPRGVRVLDELGLAAPDARPEGDMILVGPSRRRALLPALAGADYPGHGLASRRYAFDRALVEAAVDAGATLTQGRVTGLLDDAAGVRLAGGATVAADVVVGADGALSRVAEAAGLVDPDRVLWGYAVRGYLDAAVDLPYIVLWEPQRWRLFPGYGWIFPTPDGRANVGLGLGLGADRSRARLAGEALPAFVAYLARLGLASPATGLSDLLGGWLKMGQLGTVPAHGRVLLAGDAAGLVNPLQGEGIGPALQSGRAAADAILAGADGAARRYRDALREITGHHRINAPVQAALVGHPGTVSVAGRALTAPLLRDAVAGAWGMYWNDLVRGALPSRHRRIARAATRVAAAAAARSESAAWFETADTPAASVTPLSAPAEPGPSGETPDSARSRTRAPAGSTSRRTP